MELTYDASQPPDAVAWLAASEWERIDATRAFCDRHEPGLPNVELHAAIHAIVEAQIAMGDKTPVAATQDRLLAEGLSRHDTIHAIGAVLSEHLYHLMQESGGGPDPSRAYDAALENLSAASWRAMVEESAELRPQKRPRRRPKKRRK
jgi:hypothetical protein